MYHQDIIRPDWEGEHMSLRRFFITTGMILLMITSACNLPGGTGSTSNTATSVPVSTQVAQMVAGTETAQADLANQATASQAALSTDTPQFTFTPSIIPTLTFTSTPTVPMVSVSVATNCRSGPGNQFPILEVLAVGQSAQLVEQNTQIGYWIIQLASGSGTCWLWNQYATATGNTSGLPLVSPPPTPTPAGSFKVTYSSYQTCSSGYGIKFLISNDGGLTWESNQVTATDANASATETVSYDTFPNYKSSDCSLISSVTKLDPGQSGTTSVFGFPGLPTGHHFTATIKVCSLDGLLGTCLEKTISFVP
jgi:uncharacterized protein YgiM (DUF1202 family)